MLKETAPMTQMASQRVDCFFILFYFYSMLMFDQAYAANDTAVHPFLLCITAPIHGLQVIYVL